MKFLRLFTIFLTLIAGFMAANSFATDSTTVKDYKKVITKEADSYDEYIKQIKDFEKSDKFKPGLLTEDLPLDINLGDPNAPVKMVEYASLSCIHCKAFHKEVFYDLKKSYIDTGKVYFRYRHYPLNAPAVKAAIVMDCVADKDKLAFMGALFESQAQWAYVNSEADLTDKLKTISKLAGLTDTQFQACYSDEKKQNLVVTNMKRAYDELFVSSTPSIFVDGHRYLESREFEGISKYLDDLIASKKSAGNKAAAQTTKAAKSADSDEKGK